MTFRRFLEKPRSMFGDWNTSFSLISKTERYVSSKEAYMLIYVRRGDGNDPSVCSSAPPARALKVVDSLNEEHDRKCDEYQQRLVMEHFFLP